MEDADGARAEQVFAGLVEEGGAGGGETTIGGGVGWRTGAVAGGGLLVCVLLLVGPPVGGLGASPARGAGCKHAHRSPARSSRNAARHAVICLVDRRRRHHRLGPVRRNSALTHSATRHSHYMVRHHCFAHECRGEVGLLGRVENTKYLPCSCSWGLGETLAKGRRRHASPSATVRRWMHSPGHRAIVLDPRFDDVGVGVALGIPGARNANGATYTADFGHKSG